MSTATSVDASDGNKTEEGSNIQVEDLETTTTTTPSQHLTGWRLHLVSLCTCLCMLLVNSEVTVVGTSLATIVKDLNGVDKMGWIITGYLITYTGMIVMWAQLSDVFGRKSSAIATVTLFTAFSGACGASQTMNQLIISRVFQGIGAAGCWSVALTIGYEMVPKEKWPGIGAQFAVASAMGSAIGPIIGGGVSQNGNWRWVFLFCAPVGAVTVLMFMLVLPTHFPHHNNSQYKRGEWYDALSKHSITRLDIPGSAILLGATACIVAVLLEGGISFEWNSGAAIALFVVSGLLWIAFFTNEWYFTTYDRVLEPIFPWRFVRNGPWIGTLLFSFLSGIPYNIFIINIPQRFQDVEGTSPLTAGVRLLPFNLLISVAAVIANLIVGKTGIPIIWMMLLGSVLQLGGIAWFCALPETAPVPTMIYGAQVLTGFGIGCIIGMTLLITPLVVERRDWAISGGNVLQFRALGGILGLSITTTAFNRYIKTHLADMFDDASASEILKAVHLLCTYPPAMQQRIIKILSEAYNLQSKILVGFAALQVVIIVLIYRHGNQIRLHDSEQESTETPGPEGVESHSN